MYEVGQRIVTDLGVGSVLRVEHERYYVIIDFPVDNTHSMKLGLLTVIYAILLILKKTIGGYHPKMIIE
jgi:hypothetical protein